MMQRIRSSGIYFLRSQSRTIRFTTPETINTVRHSYSRDFGIFSSIRDKVSNKLEERNQAKAEDLYRNQIETLAKTLQFDLNVFLDFLKAQQEESGMSGWRSMLPGVNEMQQVQQLKSAITMIEAIDPEYRQNPNLLNGKVKRKLLEKISQSAEDMNNMLRYYEQINGLRLWLLRRTERGLPLPENQAETSRMVQLDPTGFPMKKIRAQAKKMRSR
ncbi:hypothetical protein ABG067_003437 [Albugo candida]|uniref:Signal recognition particle SRP54 subunit M-domain domain-containing protein n=1 Tax=Albugo candida TaxID=65357 RepID=A0A024GKF2_9STRA|nr:unnamed protein product [Albugo candida]|eukprot:CCI47248.1 unnamed protein product [Albugo candida]